MPRSARIPIEKIRMPISASISITPAWCLVVRMAGSLAKPRIGVVCDGRVAHPRRAAARKVHAQAAHGTRWLANAAVRVGDVDPRDPARGVHAAQAREGH